MILADILSISIKLLLVVHVLVSLLLILVVLMQRPKQEGLGAAFGGGVADQVWGAQTTNVLQKGTVFFGTLFMLLSLGLAILIGNANNQDKITGEEPPAVVDAPIVPGVLPDGGSIADQLEDAEGDTPPPAEGDTPPPAEGDAVAPADGDTEVPTDGEAPVGDGEGEAAGDVAEDKPE